MLIKIFEKLEGKNVLIASKVCIEWKILLEKQTQKYLIKEYVEKLETFVHKYSDCKAFIVLSNRPLAELIQDKNYAKNKVNEFFEQRNKKYDKKHYIKIIKKCIYPHIFDYQFGIKYGYNKKNYPNFIYCQSFVKKLNKLKNKL
jgi:hypothetical protein